MPPATAVRRQGDSTGPAVVVLPSARTACWKISGVCPVMASPGSARIVGVQTDLGISDDGFPKTPISALREPLRHCEVRSVRIISQDSQAVSRTIYETVSDAGGRFQAETIPGSGDGYDMPLLNPNCCRQQVVRPPHGRPAHQAGNLQYKAHPRGLP